MTTLVHGIGGKTMDSIEQDIIDLLGLEINENSNSDGMVYSYYVEFPRAKSLETSTLLSVLEILDINIPFDKSFTYLDIFSNNIFKKDYDDKDEEKLNSLLSELIENKENKIIFKSLDRSRETIIKILNLYNFPEGTIIIDQDDYQNELDDNLDIEEFYMTEYETYLEMNLNYFTVVKEVNYLKNLCDESNHEIGKKSLILAAFSQTESFFKSVIYNHLPNFEEAIENEEIRKFISEKFKRELGSKEGRKNIFYRIFGEKAKNEFKDLNNEYYVLRNGLAHDIGEVFIKNNSICYKNSKSIDIHELFIELINFLDSINKVENFNKIKIGSYDNNTPF